MKKEAAYTDQILDILNLDTYQYLGFNYKDFYAYTTHNPLGPVFFQDPNNLQDETNFFATNLKKQLTQTKICIVQSLSYCGKMEQYVEDTLENNLTTLAPNILISNLKMPLSFSYMIFYSLSL